MNKNRIIFIAFIISFIYVFIGTIVVMVGFPEYEIRGFDHDHFMWQPLVVITYPANILLFGLVMVDNSILSIALLQVIVFCIFWYIVYRVLRKILTK